MAELKYDSQKHPKLLLDLMSQGKVDVQVIARLDLASETFYKWIRLYPEFKEAHRKGLRLAEDWWLEQGASGAIPAPIWQRIMTVKFGYAGERSVKMKGLGKVKDINAKADVVQSYMRKGKITPGEAALITNTLHTAANINEKTEVAKDAKEILGLLKK